MNASIYDQLGGDAAVDAAVDRFYKKVLADSLLSPFFAGADMEKQHKMQKAFLTVAFGGPNHYTGRSMREAHKKPVSEGIGDEHFDKVVQLLGETLQELNVPADLIQQVADGANSMRDDVLNK